MSNDKQSIQISKFLSLILRHQPEIIGIQLDKNGWVDCKELIEKANNYGITFDYQMLLEIVETNPKKRFQFNVDFNKIRASQGHSIEIELGYTNQKPPAILYHGTSEKAVQSILEHGLEKRNRQHVHLSTDIKTAINVGQRHGKPFVFTVLAEQMFINNFKFYISDNGVWLTDFVPPNYLKPSNQEIV